MILHRVDFLFNLSKLKKASMTNMTVASYVGAVLAVDLAILIVWTALPAHTPVPADSLKKYAAVYYPVTNRECNSGLHSPLEQVMVAEKCLLLLFGCWKVCTASELELSILKLVSLIDFVSGSQSFA